METSRGVSPSARPGWTTPWPGAAVIVKESTLSTMSDALALARDGCPTGTVAAALFQEGGRGRVPGRTWQAPAGSSLLATVVLHVSELGFPLDELSLRAGTAAALGIEDAAGIRVQIKWPNDLMWAPAEGGARKVAGLLCEAHGDAALVGIGVNVAQQSFPEELAATAGSLLQACGRTLEPAAVLSAILARLKSAASLAGWREVLRSRLYRRGEIVRVDILGTGAVVEGLLVDVDDRGRLIIEGADGRRQALPQAELMSSPE
jgi:BirA family transcriptional regulator, biotin operon repressor / biotin---[acetyl-CoA-carboxylase] ligase